jgi:hypothetical protein
MLFLLESLSNHIVKAFLCPTTLSSFFKLLVQSCNLIFEVFLLLRILCLLPGDVLLEAVKKLPEFSLHLVSSIPDFLVLDFQ